MLESGLEALNSIEKSGKFSVTEKLIVINFVSAIKKYGKDKCLITIDTLLKNDLVCVGKIKEDKEVFGKIVGV
ncbi:hypothetical protein [Borrelia miyamotoi]|uniref:hypothetical protein n=1 Tax=Borrelia miyamotoi TaxID=47466 RepID=UPI001C75EC5E|nr:hypothetical protein [Borrelia miyamotoi]BCR20737.1 Septum formation protein Maf [Borrelia miyamotoi]